MRSLICVGCSRAASRRDFGVGRNSALQIMQLCDRSPSTRDFGIAVCYVRLTSILLKKSEIEVPRKSHFRWISSTDLMKCVCPRMKFVASGLSIRIVAACPSPCARDGRLSQFFNELLPTRWEIVPHLPILPETLRAIGPRIPRSVALILPNIPLHVVAFGCTSATIMTLGEGTF